MRGTGDAAQRSSAMTTAIERDALAPGRRLPESAAGRRPPPSPAASFSGILDVGRNCEALAHASRVAFLVDGEAYFRAFVHAAERAERSILILAWDFDSRTGLCFGENGETRLAI
jgi:phosphatidylserine/phosphatidylglycerophosphate/cardiolipin synthase-like enzyme